jgi:hypothetical protein
MMRFALCCAVLCLPLGCIVADDGDEGDGEQARIIAAGPVVPEVAVGPCTGQECTGRMPYGAGCQDDARLRAVKQFPGGRVSLRESPSCGTKWATVLRNDTRYSIAWVETEDGRGDAETTKDRAGKHMTTSMLHAPGTPVRACVQALRCQKPCDNQYARTYCTGFY